MRLGGLVSLRLVVGVTVTGSVLVVQVTISQQ